MSQELEIEFKNILTETEYLQLLDHLNMAEVEPIVQENFYFDTPDLLLKQKHCALRIRLKDEFAEITLKSPSDNHDHLLETNVTISPDQARALIEQKELRPSSAILEQLRIEGIEETDFTLLASLKTKRYEKAYKGALAVLDKSWYGDTHDYELELEAQTHDKGQDLFYNILLDYNIPKRETRNKIQRAFSYLGISE